VVVVGLLLRQGRVVQVVVVTGHTHPLVVPEQPTLEAVVEGRIRFLVALVALELLSLGSWFRWHTSRK